MRGSVLAIRAAYGGHRPGKVIAGLAITLFAGGEQVPEVDQLSSSPGMFGPGPAILLCELTGWIRLSSLSRLGCCMRNLTNIAPRGPTSGGTGSHPGTASVDYSKAPSNKAANSAADHIRILDQALAKLPEELYRQDGLLVGEKILGRTDSEALPGNICTTWLVSDFRENQRLL